MGAGTLVVRSKNNKKGVAEDRNPLIFNGIL